MSRQRFVMVSLLMGCIFISFASYAQVKTKVTVPQQEAKKPLVKPDNKAYNKVETVNADYYQPDSILVPRATKQDVDEFFKAYELAKAHYKKNQNMLEPYFTEGEVFGFNFTNSEHSTIPLDTDPYSNGKKFYEASRSSVIGLTTNFKVLDNMFLKNNLDAFDVEIVKTILSANTMSFITDILKTFPVVIAGPLRMSLTMNIIDENGAMIPGARCYFLSRKECRDIVCLGCQIPAVCNSALTSRIEQFSLFDSANPSPMTIAAGAYNLFIVKNDQVIHYEFRDISSLSGPLTIIVTK